MVNKRINTIKRILSDIKENSKNPIEGISICIPNDDNIFNIHGNIMIKNGIYKGILLHVIINIPDDYPLSGPSMNISQGINFGHKFHEHIFEDNINGNTICNDLLTNFSSFFKDKKEIASGWSPGYTLNTILMQMVIFFENHDLPNHLIPNKETIDNFKKELNEYHCNICNHYTRKPFPPIDMLENNNNKDYDDSLIEKVTCSISKLNIINDKDVILGYPLYIYIDKYKRIWATPILELISYEMYVTEIQKSGDYKLDFYSKKHFISANGLKYNYWIPCYFTKTHFEKSYQTLINSISILKNGTARGHKNYDFNPEDSLMVLMSLCNKTTLNILNGNIYFQN